jgi:hypothetical protein
MHGNFAALAYPHRLPRWRLLLDAEIKHHGTGLIIEPSNDARLTYGYRHDVASRTTAAKSGVRECANRDRSVSIQQQQGHRLAHHAGGAAYHHGALAHDPNVVAVQ